MTRIAVPRYNLQRIFAIRDKLADIDLTHFLGTVIEDEWLATLADDICEALPGVKSTAVCESVRYLAGTTMTESELRTLSWRLAGNLALLKTNIAVPPWHVQREREWMPIQLIDCSPLPVKFGKPKYSLTARILAGTACPLKITVEWPASFCRLVARRAGYTSARQGFPLSKVEELVNMRLWALMDPEHCRVGCPGFWEVSCSPSLKKWNTSIIKKRFRQGWECPYGYRHYCYQCHVGYLECPAATHRETRTTDESATVTDEVESQ